ncbi:leucoanthocyanidin reductase-like [Vigna unguiculata]|uniref:Leucoanthocyanidin reductase n=1 Tax=Vigna unguiculata TaxID=3917 RepID=A0A4D6N3L1_VIGUN|nr:leucoanthocyanidin reductase-like [Vigna unguiculata]QCE07878.1 leucoanthocyanidin reductase [Vigna unguiculata]
MVTSPTIPNATTTKGRVLIIGATGFIGRFVAEASLLTAHPTYLLLRPPPLVPSKDAIVKTFQEKGAIVIHGVINNKDFVEKILKEYEIDIVISAIGAKSLLDQLILVEAMKSVKTIKRFLASEFGHDVDRADPVEPGLTMYNEKRLVRRMVEKSGVPYTNICCNSIASWPYYDNCHPSQLPPPLDQLQIYGHGNVKAYFVDGIDIGKFTMKVIDDVRTVNKNVHFRPSNNCYSINELASLWEMKIGRTIPRVTVTEDDLLAAAAENCIPRSIVASFTHDIFIKGCQVNFKIDGVDDVEISTLYPDEAFRSLEDCYEDFAHMIDDKIHKEEHKIKGTKSVVEAVPITASCG